MCLMGLDIGTTGCKVSIVDIDGNILGNAYREYPLITPQKGWKEIDPVLVWESVKEIIKEVMANYKGEKIRAISASSFGEATVPVDINGNVLYNGILYIDSRGREEAEYIGQKLGFDKVLSITGASVHPMYSICKIMWIKKNMPEVYKNTNKFLMFADFILYKLGAKPHTEYSLATRSMTFDIINKKWSEEILDCTGIDKNKFGEPVQAGTVVGVIDKNIAEELGLPSDSTIVAGGHDQPCAALGAGILKSDTAVDGNGTVECITPAFDRPVISRKMADNNFVCVPHVKAGMYVTYAFNFTGGALLRWFRDNFAYEEKEVASRTGMNVYDVLIKKATKQPTDLFVMPHFAGAATPYMDTESKGVILGLNISTSKADVIKALHEGITYEMMLNLERLEEAGVNVRELRAVGGMAKSEEFLQLKADMMGKKVMSIDVPEAGALGVVMLAGTAIGIYKSLEDAVERLVKIKKEFYPDEKKHAIYEEKYQTYRKIYSAVKSIYTVN